MIVEWGCKVADEKGLEAYVEATLDGVRLYESSGFRQVEAFVLDAQLPRSFQEQAAAWNEARSKVLRRRFPWYLCGGWRSGNELMAEDVHGRPDTLVDIR